MADVSGESHTHLLRLLSVSSKLVFKSVSHQISSLSPHREQGAEWITKQLCFGDQKSKGTTQRGKSQIKVPLGADWDTWKLEPRGCCHIKEKERNKEDVLKRSLPGPSVAQGALCLHRILLPESWFQQQRVGLLRGFTQHFPVSPWRLPECM